MWSASQPRAAPLLVLLLAALCCPSEPSALFSALNVCRLVRLRWRHSALLSTAVSAVPHYTSLQTRRSSSSPSTYIGAATDTVNPVACP